MSQPVDKKIETEDSASVSQRMLTPEGYARLQAELEHLTVVKRAEIAERLRESKQHGEFSEDNSELDEVKFEQAIVENRITELRSIFAGANVLDPKAIPKDTVAYGSYVKVKDTSRRNVEFEVRVVDGVESDPDNDLVSADSPMGSALMGKKVGDDAIFEAPVGRLKYKITGIRR